MERQVKNCIIITSIFEPTPAVRKFSELKDFHVVVVGDKKSPAQYDCNNVTFLPVSQNQGTELERVLPYNHYCRKMLGYIYALRNGAELLYDTDDDNTPKDNFYIPEFEGDFPSLKSENTFANVYKCYSNQKIWPRGYPLELLTNDPNNYNLDTLDIKKQKIGVWQSIVDNEPDVDAIYRLTSNELCTFKSGEPVVLETGTVCPFNSQATAFRKELVPLMYLPSTVTFRFTDILRGLVAQPIMWKAGYHLGFTNACVIQERNVHNYLKDFESEIPCYLFAKSVIEKSMGIVTEDKSVSENLFAVYCMLEKEGIVKPFELDVLKAWLKDISSIE